MIKTVIYVPMSDNSGQPFAAAELDALRDRLTQFGGFTVQTNITGVWVDEGRRYTDQNHAYTVALASVRQLPAWLEMIEWAIEAFRQEALYVEINGAPEIVRKANA